MSPRLRRPLLLLLFTALPASLFAGAPAPGAPAAPALAAATSAPVVVQGRLVRMPGVGGPAAAVEDHGVAVPLAPGAGADVPTGASVRLTVPGALAAGLPAANGTAALAGRAVAAGGVRPAALTVLAGPVDDYRPGRQHLRIVIVRPAGVPGAFASRAQIRAQVAGASRYWAGQTRGGITFDVASISAPYASAIACSPDPKVPWADALWNEAAARTGYSGQENTHLVLAFPRGADDHGCAYGLATYGAGANAGGKALVSDTAWPVLAHELGHNLGLGHAQSLRCSRADADLAALPAGCSVVGYGDSWDVMAASGQTSAGALGVEQAIRLGVLGGADVARVNRGSATVDLAPVGAMRGRRAVQITDPRSGRVYDVEYRRHVGADAVQFASLADGVRIVAADTGQYESRGSVVLAGTGRTATRLGNTLAAGSTFVSASGGVRVRVVSAGATARVQVSVTP